MIAMAIKLQILNFELQILHFNIQRGSIWPAVDYLDPQGGRAKRAEVYKHNIFNIFSIRTIIMKRKKSLTISMRS